MYPTCANNVWADASHDGLRMFGSMLRIIVVVVRPPRLTQLGYIQSKSPFLSLVNILGRILDDNVKGIIARISKHPDWRGIYDCLHLQ